MADFKFEWKDVGQVIAPMAPTIGGLLGGFIPFPGGALAGQALGSIIAKQFGVEPTPEAVKNAIQNNPNEVVLAKLHAATEEAKAQWPAIAEIEIAHTKLQAAALGAVNETMRVELAHQHWFFTGWRPACGWVFVFANIAFGVLLAYATLKAVNGDDKALVVITNAWPIYTAYFGILAAMVGVYVVGRSNEKAALNKAAEVVPPAPTVPVKPPAKK